MEPIEDEPARWELPTSSVAWSKHWRAGASTFDLLSGAFRSVIHPSADWLQDPAPPAYFQLIGKLGSILTGVFANAISAGAIECEKRALAAKGEEGNVESSGIRLQCQAFEHAGGGTTLLLAPAANTIPPG